MKRYLFLDDERQPSEVTWITIPDRVWDIVRTQDEFEAWIDHHGIPQHISFDNDLGDGAGEGRFCVDYLINYVLDRRGDFPQDFTFTVHSMNPIAAETIRSKMMQILEYSRS